MQNVFSVVDNPLNLDHYQNVDDEFEMIHYSNFKTKQIDFFRRKKSRSLKKTLNNIDQIFRMKIFFFRGYFHHPLLVKYLSWKKRLDKEYRSHEERFLN